MRDVCFSAQERTSKQSMVGVSEMNGELHCGACQKPMQDEEQLTLHLKTCPAAKALLLPMYGSAFGGDPGHSVGHLVMCCNKHYLLIEQYAEAVASDMNSLDRAKLHAKLCERLYLDYNEFRPFQSEAITKMPTQLEAEAILWDEIGKVLREFMVGNLRAERKKA